MQVWNVLHAARWNTGRKKDAKIGHLRTTAKLCQAISSQLRHVSTIGKKPVKQQYPLHMLSQYGELRPTNGRDRLAGLGHPSKFQRGSPLGSVMFLYFSYWVTFVLLANVNLFAICCRPSVCRLSVVGNARAPYSGGSNFPQYFYGIRYLGHPLTSTENFTEIVPGEPLCRRSKTHEG